MKTMDEWESEIQSRLAAKVDAVVEAFQANREQGLQELCALDEILHGLEAKRQELTREKAGLRTIKNADLKRYNEIERKLPGLAKELSSCQKKIDGLVGKLTDLPALNAPMLNFLSEADFSPRPAKTYADIIKGKKAVQDEIAQLEAEHGPFKDKR